MTKFNVLLFLLLHLFVGQVFAEVFNGATELSFKRYDSLSINGSALLKMVKAKILDIEGPLQFRNLDVAIKAQIKGDVKGERGKFGSLIVNGSMNVDHVICGELSVNGSVTAYYLDVTNHAMIEGELEARHSQFKSLSVKANKILLNEVILEELLVKKDEKNQKVILKGATTVNGDIVFESGEGIVQIEGPDVQFKGTLKGGKLFDDRSSGT